VHVDPRLRQYVGEQRLEHAVERGALRRRQRHAAVARHVPIRKQLEFARQQRAVVLGQHAGPAGALP